MTEFPDAKIYLVDDDVVVREALAWLLRTRRLVSDGYDSAEAFLADAAASAREPHVPCCVLLDVRMPGMSGLTLFEPVTPPSHGPRSTPIDRQRGPGLGIAPIAEDAGPHGEDADGIARAIQPQGRPTQ